MMPITARDLGDAGRESARGGLGDARPVVPAKIDNAITPELVCARALVVRPNPKRSGVLARSLSTSNDRVRCRKFRADLDIAPTLLALAGIEKIPSEMRGTNLFADNPQATYAISEDIAYGANARAISDGSHKLVVYDRTKTGDTRFLYSTTLDGSAETLIQDPMIEKRLTEALESNTTDPVEGLTVELDEESRRALRALGY